METTVQIVEVNSKQVQTSRGLGTVYTVKASDGREYSTFKKQLGQKAGELRGQTATIAFSEVQKGNYTNYYLESVAAAPEASVTSHGSTVTATGTTPTLTTLDNRSGQINRSVAFKAAVDLYISGAGSVDGPVAAIADLTEALLPVVDGTYEPLGEPVLASTDEASLIDF